MRHVVGVHGYSARRACRLLAMNRRTFRRPAPPDKDAVLRERLRELAQVRRRFGSPRLTVLLRREGWGVNHKRVERVYREEGLSLRMRRRRKRPSHLRVVLPGPRGPDQRWSMDFMSDALLNGRRLRLLTMVDGWDRRCPHIEVDHALTGERVVRVLERLQQLGRRPAVLQMDNGPEFTSKALDRWADENGVKLQFTRPGKPTDNGQIESFNGRVREECLNQQVFASLAEAREVIEAWRQDYNQERPHSALGGLSPEMFRRQFESTAESLSPNLTVVHSAG